jgi:ribosomal protein S12 methylthiotransferase
MPDAEVKINLHVVSLGCPKNLVDSEIILGGLAGSPLIHYVSDPRQADVIIINTCGFIEDAKKESIAEILEAVELKKKGLCRQVFVTGCLSQRYREVLLKEIPEIDGIWGARNVETIRDEMATLLGLEKPGSGRFFLESGSYAYLKIAEGCDNLCSFCAIPAIRGPHRSRPPETIVREAEELASRGVKEIILVSQDTTYYGWDLGGRSLLPDLLRQLETVRGIEWIRVLYLYPDRVTDELIRTIADSEKICHYFDVPLQHISDRILRRMRRGSRKSTIFRLLEKIRRWVPDAAIRTSLMVGFPGETEADFEELVEFVEAVEFDRMGVFTFSPEEGTEAADELGDDIPEPVKKERQEVLQEIQRNILARKNRSLIGRSFDVLLDAPDGAPERKIGRTRWDAPEIDLTVLVTTDANPGEVVRARIVDASEFELLAKAETEPARGLS